MSSHFNPDFGVKAIENTEGVLRTSFNSMHQTILYTDNRFSMLSILLD